MEDKRLTGWTEERVAKLKELWDAGWSASEIAAEFGLQSRNAVCGKIDRLGLSGQKRARKMVTQRAPRTRPVAAHSFKAERIVAPRTKPTPEIKPEPFVVSQSPFITSLDLTIDQLTEATCKWPHGDLPPFLYCGQPPESGKPFCGAHCRIAYVPPPNRRNELDRRELGRSRGGIFGKGKAA